MERLFKIQQGLVATKSQYNGFGKYRYRTTEGIIEAVKPMLREQGLYLCLTDKMSEVAGRAYLTATASLYDIDTCKLLMSAEGFSRDEPYGGMSAGQGTGASSSYARKYALCGLFGIDGSEDHDELDKTVRDNEPNTNGTVTETEMNSDVSLQTGQEKPTEETAPIPDAGVMDARPVLASLKKVKSRAEFEEWMRNNKQFWGVPTVKEAMTKMAKLYPKT